MVLDFVLVIHRVRPYQHKTTFIDVICWKFYDIVKTRYKHCMSKMEWKIYKYIMTTHSRPFRRRFPSFKLRTFFTWSINPSIATLSFETLQYSCSIMAATWQNENFDKDIQYQTLILLLMRSYLFQFHHSSSLDDSSTMVWWL